LPVPINVTVNGKVTVAGVTVSVVEPLTVPEVAFISELPVLTPLASPVPAPIVATAGVAELHVTLLVRFCVLLSENVPVAVNCSVVPLTIDGLVGVTAIDTSVAGPTVSVVEPLIPPVVAVINELPTARPLASPVLPI
jgi:hypothetical protein